MTITETDLLSELVAEISMPPLLPDDITATRLQAALSAQGCNKSYNACGDRLKAKAKAGELVAVKCVDENGHVVTAYRKAEK